MAINKNDFKNAEGNYEAKNALMDAVIDGVNGNEANLSLIDFSSSLTAIDGVGYLSAYKVGRMHFLSFSYKPTQTGFTLNVISGMPSAYRPVGEQLVAGSVASSTSATDASLGIAAYMVSSSGSIGITTGTLPDYALRFYFTWVA